LLINSNNQVSLIYQAQRNTANTATNSNTAIKSESTADKVTISKSGLNAESKWQEAANQYNPRNMSYHELGKMSSALELNGLITPQEGLALRAPPSMNFDPNEKYDTLALAKKSVAFDQSLGATGKDAQLRGRALQILETIQDLSDKVSA
jgi:hypothetical protein